MFNSNCLKWYQFESEKCDITRLPDKRACQIKVMDTSTKTLVQSTHIKVSLNCYPPTPDPTEDLNLSTPTPGLKWVES